MYVCVCVLMVKASCCFCRFNVISFFFNYDNDYGHHRSRRMLHIIVTRLTDSNNVPQKNNLQVFRDIHVHSFLCTPSCPIHEHKSFIISATSLSPKKKPSSKHPHLWGWHVAERCYVRLLAIYPSDQRLHSNC